MRFYLLSPYPLPHHCAVLLHSDLLLGGVASTPSPISVCPNRRDRIHPEPGGWAWPCTDFSCILCERGRVQDTWSPAPPFTGAAALNFSLCLPSPRCQIAITSSWNCSVASLGSRFPWPSLGMQERRGDQLRGPGFRQGERFSLESQALSCPVQGHTWKPCTNIRDSASLHPHRIVQCFDRRAKFYYSPFGDQGCSAGSLLSK